MDFTLNRKQQILRLLTFHTMMLRNTSDTLKSIISQHNVQKLFQPKTTDEDDKVKKP
jgi:hypothetical protein